MGMKIFVREDRRDECLAAMAGGQVSGMRNQHPHCFN